MSYEIAVIRILNSPSDLPKIKGKDLTIAFMETSLPLSSKEIVRIVFARHISPKLSHKQYMRKRERHISLCGYG